MMLFNLPGLPLRHYWDWHGWSETSWMRELGNKTISSLMGKIDALLDVKRGGNRTVVTVFALLIFVGGLLVALRNLDAGLHVELPALTAISMLVLLVLTFAVNVVRTHTHAKIVGASLTAGDSARISLFSSAMNMLPLIIPAGMYMRMSNFVRHGGGTGHVAGVLVTNYLLSLASSLAIGIAMIQSSMAVDLSLLVAVIVACYAALAIVFVRISGVRHGITIALLELVAVAIDAARIFLCFQILGFGVEIAQAAVLTVSAILGSAVSIVPAGLGIRELVGAGISPLIKVVPGQAFLAIALNRVFGVAFFAGLAALVLWRDRNEAR
jgi:uncharacterized membrane protein YbhN (UPF0104 family)